MTAAAPATPKLELGTRVRFTRRMAGYRVRVGSGWGSPSTSDPVDGYQAQAARDRCRELTTGDDGKPAEYGTFRVVVEWPVRERRDYDLRNHDQGIIVGRTFRYEGRVEYDEGFMVGVSGVKSDRRGWSNPRRVECWKVQQTLNRRPVLVPIDAVEVID